MAKFYIKSGKCRTVRQAGTPLEAAIKSVSTWKAEKRKMDTTVRVSEVGFDGDHPHHEQDAVMAMTFVKGKIKR